MTGAGQPDNPGVPAKAGFAFAGWKDVWRSLWTAWHGGLLRHLLVTCYHKWLRDHRLPAAQGAPALLLSFDDGPDAAYTPQLLDLLAEQGVRANFFLLAEKAAARPELVARIRAAGHYIGLHGLRHSDNWRLGAGEAEAELQTALRTMQNLGCRITDYRPPYGHLRADSPALLERYGLTLRLWSLMGRDWRGMSAERLVKRLRRHAANGAVICLHDGAGGHAVPGSADQMLAALRILLPEWKQQGYRFLTYAQADPAPAAGSLLPPAPAGVTELPAEAASLPAVSAVLAAPQAAGIRQKVRLRLRKAPPGQPLNKTRQRLALLLPVLLLISTFCFLLHHNPLPELLALRGQLSPVYLLYAVGALAVFFCCEAACLRLLLRASGHAPGPFRAAAYALVDFYFSSITPGNFAGQPAQLYYMQRDGIRLGSSTPTLLLFNFAYHIAVLLVVGVSSLLAGGLPAIGVGRVLLIYGATAQLLLALAYVAAVFSPRLLPSLVRRGIALLARVKLVKRGDRLLAKAEAQIAAYRESAAYLRRRPLLLLPVLILATLHILALYSLAWWVYRALGLTQMSFFYLLAMQAALTLAVESLPLPGGAGVTEGGFLLLYGHVFGPALVLPALLLLRCLNYYLPLAAGGLISALLKPTRQRRVYRYRCPGLLRPPQRRLKYGVTALPRH